MSGYDPSSKTALVERSRGGDPLVAPPGPEMSWTEGTERAEPGVNLASLLHSLRRCWLRALGLAILLSGLTAAAMWLLLPVMFTAEALIEVKKLGPSIDGSQRFESDPAYERFRETQASYIKSTWIIGTAIRQEASISKFHILRRARNKAAWISDHIKVRPLGDSELLELQLRADNAREVTTLLQAVLNAYDQRVLQASRQEKGQQLEKLNNAILERKKAMESMTREYIKLAQNENLPTSPQRLTAALEMIQKNITDKSQNITEMSRSLRDINLKVMAAERMTTTGGGRISEHIVRDEIERYPDYAELRERKAELVEERDQQARRFPNAAPSSLQSEIGRLEQRMKSRYKELEPGVRARLMDERGDSPQALQNQLDVGKAQRDKLTTEIDTIKLEVETLRRDYAKLNNDHADFMQRDAEIKRETEVLEQLNLKKAILDIDMKEPPRITIVQAPEIREESSLLIRLFEIFSASGLVFGLTAAGVLFWDYQTKRVNSAADVASTLELPLLGSLPLIHNDSLISLGTRDPQKLELVLTQSTDSVRAAVLFNRQVGPVKVLMITSAVDQEGRTTLASQLAISMARSGRKTLLIDADVMNPQQHHVFNIPGTVGLCDVLDSSRAAWRDVVRATNIENLWLMPAGTVLGDIQFVSDDANALFNDLRSQFEMIVLETGPVLTGAEALLLGQYVDAAIVSVRRDESRMPRVEAASERLRAVGITILGAVLHNDGTAIRRNVTVTSNVPRIESPRATPTASPSANLHSTPGGTPSTHSQPASENTFGLDDLSLPRDSDDDQQLR